MRLIQCFFILFVVPSIGFAQVTYKVLPGDTLTQVLQKLGINRIYGPKGNLNKLIALNPNLKSKGDLILPDQELSFDKGLAQKIKSPYGVGADNRITRDQDISKDVTLDKTPEQATDNATDGQKSEPTESFGPPPNNNFRIGLGLGSQTNVESLITDYNQKDLNLNAKYQDFLSDNWLAEVAGRYSLSSFSPNISGASAKYLYIGAFAGWKYQFSEQFEFIVWPGITYKAMSVSGIALGYKKLIIFQFDFELRFKNPNNSVSWTRFHYNPYFKTGSNSFSWALREFQIDLGYELKTKSGRLINPFISYFDLNNYPLGTTNLRSTQLSLNLEIGL